MLIAVVDSLSKLNEETISNYYVKNHYKTNESHIFTNKIFMTTLLQQWKYIILHLLLWIIPHG